MDFEVVFLLMARKWPVTGCRLKRRSIFRPTGDAIETLRSITRVDLLGDGVLVQIQKLTMITKPTSIHLTSAQIKSAVDASLPELLKERYAMSRVPLSSPPQPEAIDDPLSELAREGAASTPWARS
jgi:hypothetical protein